MGVNFPTIAFRVPSQRGEFTVTAAMGNDCGGGRGRQRRCNKGAALVLVSMAELCRDDNESRPSLGKFLEVEWRFDDVALFVAFDAELKGGSGRTREGGMLFIDKRVSPPRQEEEMTGSKCGALLGFTYG